jgi:hypothetical protein
MRSSCWNIHSFTLRHWITPATNLDIQSACEDEKKLMCKPMGMKGPIRAGRHPLLFDIEIRRFQKVPGFASSAPLVVLRYRYTGGFHRKVDFSCFPHQVQ